MQPKYLGNHWLFVRLMFPKTSLNVRLGETNTDSFVSIYKILSSIIYYEPIN